MAELADTAAAKRHILVVDNDADSRNVITRVLSAAGYHVLVAGGGQEALELMESAPIDLVLSDVMMDEFGGPELVQRLRQRGHDVPIVLISVDPGQNPRIEDVPFIPAPVSFPKLRATIERLIGDGAR